MISRTKRRQRENTVMADAFVIETTEFTAGIVAAHPRGYRFYASHPSMSLLEGQIVGSPQAAQKAAEKLATNRLYSGDQVRLWRD